MRRSLSLLPVLCLVAGCAHEGDIPAISAARVTAAASSAATVPPDREVIAVDTAPAEVPVPPSRRRLDHVVSLGETTLEPYAPSPSPGAAGSNGGVVINNNITVNGGSPGYGGYGYGGYYGGSGYGYGARGAGRGTTSRTGSVQGSDVGSAAQAPPVRAGQTPGVGGNWPTIPSYGPRQMR